MSQQQHHDTTSRMRNIKTTPRKRSKFASEIKRSWKASTTPSARQTTRGGEVSWLCKYYVLKAMLNRQHKSGVGVLYVFVVVSGAVSLAVPLSSSSFVKRKRSKPRKKERDISRGLGREGWLIL